MEELKKRYESKFNSQKSVVKTNEFWNRYYKKGERFFYNRMIYCLGFLYGRVLDVGSADGFGAHLMTKNLNIKSIICLEIQDRAIKKAKRNLTPYKNIFIKKGIAEQIPFPDNSFDSVHCGATLEHVFDDKKAISEIARVTKDLVVMAIPIGGGTSVEHVRQYKTPESFKERITPFFIIIEERIFKRDNNRKSMAFICRKKNV